MALRLEIKDIQMRYAGKRVLEGCTFTFEHGVYAVMGPNGSGKSTLLRICALLENPTAGDLLFSDAQGPAENGLALRRRLTYVLPRAGIFNTTVYGNAAYGLRVRGLSNEETADKVHDALRTVGLLAKARQNALTLSSGESQRLALARAMVIEPEVLFLDEPTASVDADNTVMIEDLITEMGHMRSPMVIMATHDREQAARLSEHILYMEQGKLVPK